MKIIDICQATALLIIAATAISLGYAQPASAYLTDPTAVSNLQNARKDLLAKEYTLLRDQDDLNRQIWDLKKTNNDPQNKYVINDLCQKLDAKYSQLQRTRWELKQIEKSLL